MGVLFTGSFCASSYGGFVVGDVGFELGRGTVVKEGRQVLRKISVSVRREDVFAEGIKVSNFELQLVGF